jgi:hypothetical protein
MEHRVASQHLTDEQFAGLLLGTNPSSVQAHLKACPQCAEEAQRVSGAIGSFEQQSRLWAERRTASHPILAPQRQPVFQWLHLPANSRGWTTAFALSIAIALAAGIGVSVRNDRPRPAQQQAANPQPSAPQLSPATLKADNELLSAIDGELRADESTPASVYGLIAGSHGSRSRAAKRTSDE